MTGMHGRAIVDRSRPFSAPSTAIVSIDIHLLNKNSMHAVEMPYMSAR